ncbi:MAG TPA: hypothetical protein VN040_11580, partial [Pseudosphingobacterium sp.]|nr:hypothetical protein [Pseudosphingobacterium sp.]
MSDQLNMGQEFIWKNFHLGTELEIAGNFIYDAMYAFDQMKHFYFEAEIFDCLYHLSVGIERLQKITLILLTSFNNNVDLEFEKKLVSHSSQHFHQRISSFRKIQLGKNENKLLTLLTKFYDKNRYGRFNFRSSNKAEYEKYDLIHFLSHIMKGSDFEIDPSDVITINDELIKVKFGDTVKKIVIPYYNIIEEICRKQNFY